MKTWIVLLFVWVLLGCTAPVAVQAPAPVGGQPGFAPAKGYWVEVIGDTPFMETLAMFMPPDTTQDEDVVVISHLVEEIHKNGKGVFVFICLDPQDAVFVLPNISCRSLYWFPVTKITPTG